jgi:hypothetical protein
MCLRSDWATYETLSHKKFIGKNKSHYWEIHVFSLRKFEDEIETNILCIFVIILKFLFDDLAKFIKYCII